MILRRTFKILLLTAAGFVALSLLLMLALKLALERAPQYQAQIKDWVFHRSGYHIAFAHVWPAFRWYGPELSVENRLERPAGRHAGDPPRCRRARGLERGAAAAGAARRRHRCDACRP